MANTDEGGAKSSSVDENVCLMTSLTKVKQEGAWNEVDQILSDCFTRNSV